MVKFRSKIKNGLRFYSNANVAVKSALWFTICSVIQKGISVITMPIFTRLMTTEQYGDYNIFLTWYNIFTIIITLNIQSELFNKGLVEHLEKKDEFTANQSGLLIALTSLFILIYLPFQIPINKLTGLSTIIVIIMMLEILANSLIGLWSARKKFDFEYRKIIFLTLSISVFNPLVGVAAVTFSSEKVAARIMSNAAVAVVGAIIVLCLIRSRSKIFQNIKWWKPVVLASLPLLPHYLSLVLLNQSDKLMINYFVGSEAAAIYSVAHSLGLLTVILNNAINGAYVPWLYNKLNKKDFSGVGEIYRLLISFVILASLVFIWLGPEIINVLSAPQYSDAVWCLVPIALSVFFAFVYTIFVDIEIYYDGNKYIAIASICAACLNIALNYSFIPRYGYIAAGYTTLVSYFFTMIMHYIFTKHIMKKNGITKSIIDFNATILMSMLMFLLAMIAMLLFDYMYIRLVIIAITVALIIVKRKNITEVIHTFKKK